MYTMEHVYYTGTRTKTESSEVIFLQLGAQLQTKYLGEEILIHPQAICRQNSLQAHLSMNDVTLSIFPQRMYFYPSVYE